MNELIERGYVRETHSPCAVTDLLIYIYHHHQNRLPMPSLKDMLDEISGPLVFTKIDFRKYLSSNDNRGGEEWKTTFKKKTKVV